RIFAPIQSLENEGILYVFQRVKKASQSLPPAGGRLPSLPGYCQIFAKLSALPIFLPACISCELLFNIS
ncbi:MAG: hypothetical protein EGQ26_03055, partial [Clostridiales bacterium]|nr:hypothetical protein [Clostridiales bacterium]